MSRSEDQIPETIVSTAKATAAWETYHRSGMQEIIGNYNLCQALNALSRTDMAKRLTGASTPVAAEEVLSGVNAYLGKHLLRYLGVRGVLTETQEGYQLTQQGKDLLSEVALAQLGFYREAYGPIVERLPEMLSGELLYGQDVERDGGALGRHCSTLFSTFHTEVVLQALSGVDAKCILDIGCGSGGMLLDLCRSSSHLRGIGLDISAPAIDVARQTVSQVGMEDRLSFVVGDAFQPETWPEICDSADVITGVGVLHEHFRAGEGAVLEMLNLYADLVRDRNKCFLLGEPELHYDCEENDDDLYLIHIFTAQGFPRRRELWLELFGKSNMKCERVYRRSNAGPRFAFYELHA